MFISQAVDHFILVSVEKQPNGHDQKSDERGRSCRTKDSHDSGFWTWILHSLVTLEPADVMRLQEVETIEMSLER